MDRAELARLIVQAHHDAESAPAVDDQPCADEDKHQDEATRVRRPELVVAMAMFSLALTGTVGAFGYRAMIGGALLPVVPPIIKAIEKLVSREEQPVRIEQPKQTRGVISTIPLTRGGSLPGVGTPTSPAAASQLPRRVAAAANPSSQSAGPSSGFLSFFAREAQPSAPPESLGDYQIVPVPPTPSSPGREA